MNLMENVMGALAKGKSKSTIYFCSYTHTDTEKKAIQHLVNETRLSVALNGNSIKVLAIESVDEMCADIRLVGLMYEGNVAGQYKTLILEKYEDLSLYFEDMEDIL